MSLFAQHSSQGEWRWTGLPDSTPDQALPLQGLLQAQTPPECLLSSLPRINKHFFQFVRFQFATCHMLHGHLPPRLAVPSAGSAAASVLSSAACDRQSSASFPFSISLNLSLSLSLPHFLSHSHTHTHIARFLWPLTSVFFLFHSFADFHFACRFLLISLFSHSDCFFPLVPLCFFFCFFCLCFSFIIAAPRRP